MSDDFSRPDLTEYEAFVERRFDEILARVEIAEEELVVLERLVAQLEAIEEEDPASTTGFQPPDADTVERLSDSVDIIAETTERLEGGDDETDDITDGAGIENIDDDSQNDSKPVNEVPDESGDKESDE